MKLIVGLGNVGKEFENTVHNMGFRVVDKVAKELNIVFKKNYCSSLIAEGNYNGEKVILAKPTTFMNLSGLAVKSLVKKFNLERNDFLIVSDDIDLPSASVRYRESGTAGTHNGLRNIVKELKTTSFNRLRIGVGKPPENVDLADYVLSHKVDNLVEISIDKGKEACMMFLEGISNPQIMQKVNTFKRGE